MSEVVVVTGGASGMGLATARHLLAAGRRVAILDINAKNVQTALGELSGHSANVAAFQADVCDKDQLETLSQTIEQQLGPVSSLVTCAGMTRPEPAETMSLETWREIVDVNLTGTFLTCQVFCRGMLLRGKGSVVTISSASGLGGRAGRVNYVAAKWGVIGLAKSLAIEWGQRGIRVNCIAPGAIKTPMYAKLPDTYRDLVTDRTPLARPADPDEVSAAIIFLLSDAASFVTGSVLAVDGGYTAGFGTYFSGSGMAV